MLLVSESSTTLVFPWRKNSGRPEAETRASWHFRLENSQIFLNARCARVGQKNECTELAAAAGAFGSGGGRAASWSLHPARSARRPLSWVGARTQVEG